MLSTIGIIIDIAIVLTLVVFGVIGFKKGLLKSVLSLFSWAVCILIAVFTAKYVASWLNGIYDFSGWIGGKIANGLDGMNDVFGKSMNTFENTDAIISSLEGANLNGFLLQMVKVVFSNSNVDINTEATVSNVVGSSLGYICMLVISGILVFIVLKIVIALLSRLFDNIARTKILGGLNKLLGLGFGLLKAGCIIIIFNCVLVALSLVPAVNDTVTPIVQDNTRVEKVIYNKTDEIVGEYIVENETIQNWITELWNNR